MVRVVIEIKNEDKEKEAVTAVAIAKASHKILDDIGFVGCSVSAKELPEENEGKIDIPAFLASRPKGEVKGKRLRGGGRNGTANN